MSHIASPATFSFPCVILAMMMHLPPAAAGDIPFDYVELERLQVYSEGQDFDSWGALKSAVKECLDDYECPNCKGHQCKGRFVLTIVRKVDIYREVEKTGFFGGKKKVDEFVKTAWRVEEIVLKQKDGGWGILSDEDEGFIACGRKNCGWEIRGGTKPVGESSVRWVTLGEILKGDF